MNYIQILVGLMAGVIYSLLGYLKNTSRIGVVEVDPREVVEKILKERDDLEKLEEAVSIISLILWSKVIGEKLYFNWREFSKTVIQGLIIGLLTGLFNTPLDLASSFVTQLGAITLTRKTIAIMRNIYTKVARL